MTLLPVLWRSLPVLAVGAAAAGCLLVATLRPATADAPVTDPLLNDPAGLREAYSRPTDQWPAFVADPSLAHAVRELGQVPDPVYPDDRPYSKAVADLGEVLFFDPRLSATNQMACASCHDPDLGWADGRTFSFGTNRLVLARNAPSAQYSGHFAKLFWDSRASSLEELTQAVIDNRDELHGFSDKVAAKLNRVGAYRNLFTEAFADEPVADVDATADRPVTVRRITQAIATFVRTLNADNTRFDAFLRGRHNALTDQELRGLHLYRTQAGCMNCHDGPLMTDDKLHVTGLHLYQRPDEDLGAYLVTGKDEDRGAFRTPSLRNISRTGPYMHHGLFHNLESVVAGYNGGMAVGRPRGKQLEDPDYPVQSPLVKPLGLSRDDLADLEAFLRTTEVPQRRIVAPKLPDFPPHER